MKVLAVTCYTGGEELAAMTGGMLSSLEDCIHKSVELMTSAVAQGVEKGNEFVGANIATVHPVNVGFGFGMNMAIESGQKMWTPDYVLCLNNDLQFPNKKWLSELLLEASPNHICVPATDKSAVMIQKAPVNREPLLLQEMSAYCWLVPFAWCQWLKEHQGFWLFDEEFGSYGEDNYTAFLLSKVYGKKVFRYVRRSWVKHLRGRTAAVVRPDRKRSSRLLIDRFKQQLTKPRLRSDLQQWARRYIAILSGRVR